MKKTSNSMATAAVILSLVGFFTLWCGGSVIFGSLAVLFALLSRGDGHMLTRVKVSVGISIVGMILGISTLIASFYLVFTDPSANALYREYMQYYLNEYMDENISDDIYDDTFDQDTIDEDDLYRFYEEFLNEDNNHDSFIHEIPQQTTPHHGETIL